MYIEIHELKVKGFSNTKIAKILKISRPTVIKYLKMKDHEFEKELESQKQRTKKPEVYQSEIIKWLRQYPEMTAAQVYDWLEEKYKDLNFNESTMRNFVRYVREEYNIPKVSETRQYEAVDDPPMGKQMQVDFGEKKVLDSNGKEIKLFVMCFVLSHSRYKYCYWQSRPFTTIDIVRIHEDAFEYFGGYPEEAVYDQDHLILVSENHGDLIYTKEFAAYLKKRNFHIYMCRRADPESKGKVEKAVGYVKDNFASNRTFYGIDRWNEDCRKWLKRRANGKIHSTTRKIPAEVFQNERKYLKPIADKIISKSQGLSITYQVRKDNTIPVKGNRYTVPKGTYKGIYTYVGVTKIDNQFLVIYDLDDGKEIARHEIPSVKGALVCNNNHRRNNSVKIPKLLDEVTELFTDTIKSKAYLEEIYSNKPRYIRDQLIMILESSKNYSKDAMDKSLDYCVKNRLISAVDFKDAVKHFSRIQTDIKELNESPNILANPTPIIHAKAQIRDINEYVKILNGTDGGNGKNG